MVQRVFWIYEAKNATEIDEHCQPEQMGTKEFDKKFKTIQTFEDCGVPATEAQNGGSKDKRKEPRERSIRDS